MLYKGSCHSGLLARRLFGGAGITLAVVFLSIVLITSGCGAYSDNNVKIEINSCVVRDRLIPFDHLIMRSMIIVGFKILPAIDNISDMTIRGELYHNNTLLAEDAVIKPDLSANNLGFDILLTEGPFPYEQPLSIPDGKYRIIIKLFDAKNHLITQTEKELKRNQIGRTFHGFDKIYNPPQYILVKNQEDDRYADDSEKTTASLEDRSARGPQSSRIASLKDRDAAHRLRFKATDKKTTEKDYVIFKKSYLERVYIDTQPKAEEIITRISTEISRNEQKPLTFSMRATQDLGRVKLSISKLKDKQGKDAGVTVDIGAVNQLTEVVRKDDKKNVVYYQYAPRIIEDKEVTILQNQTQTYWITIKTTSDTKPGDYYGKIKVIPQSGRQTAVPLQVKVLPLTLTDTDKQYGMMMDYAFYELDNETWTEKDKEILRNRGVEIYRDLKDHGMTMIYPHSHFYYKVDKNGEPILNSLRSSLESYKKEQFPGPFVWYLGHLLQTAKSMHPGSIQNYDPQIAKKRLHDLLEKFEKVAKEVGIPKEKLIVQLVDEPDADQKERTQAGKELHKVAKGLGFKTLITRPWTDVDIMCTVTPDNENQAKQLRSLAKEWWIYPNSALNSKNLAYTRYVFGFGAWRWGVDGVVPWTYQMSQGSNGNPFTVLDGSETLVAYPGAVGPLTTPLWEAIRDGINDYKYIYLLEKHISVEKNRMNRKAHLIDEKLKQFKRNFGRGPSPEEAAYGDSLDSLPHTFDKNRKQIVEWLLELSQSALK